jgi:shikimate kinase
MAAATDPHLRILLIGMMGAGKSTVGRAISARSGWPYLDNDELVRSAAGRPANDVLRAQGESRLRTLERAALDAVLGDPRTPLVASVAAGVILDPDARREMSEHGFVVYLRASIPTLAARVGAGDARPWLSDDPVATLTRLGAGRDGLYRATADLVLEVDGVAPDALATEVLRVVTG